MYFSKQIIDVENINFLTGKTGAGKSTVIDALQIVLLGELNSRNFNKAANESSQRSLDSYLRADMDSKNPKTRRGKDFSSYIACQFVDEISGTRFVSGIVFDCHSDGNRREQFFIYNGVIPDHCFLIDRQTMDISALRGYLKTLPDAREVFYDSNTQYRNDLLAKWNVHNEQVCRMLKKAVSFRPIIDIQKFITENICDIPEKPDIESMQQNIRDYKRHEMLAKRQEEKLSALTEINRLFYEMQMSLDRLQVQRFLVLWAQKNDLSQQIEKLTIERNDCSAGIRKAQDEYEAIDKQIILKDQRKNELIADRERSDVFQEENRLRKQKDQLIQEQTQIIGQINDMVQEIKKESQVLCNLCSDISRWTKTVLLQDLLDASIKLSACCQLLLDCTVEYFSNVLEPFEAVQDATHVFSVCLRDSAFQINEQVKNLQDDLIRQREILDKLKNNIKDYPKSLIDVKEQLEMLLSKKHSKTVSVCILADELEIAEGYESWRGAIEGYLNTQKLYLLVDPSFYVEALAIFDALKRDFGKLSFGLIDVGKLREREKFSPWDDSLAKIIQTDNPLARSYIDFLLGRVVRCSHVSQLRKHKTAITEDGMLYQGYVARPIPKHIMEDTFIGRKAVALRMDRIKESIAILENDESTLLPINNVLNRRKDMEFLFTRRFLVEAQQKQEDFIRGLEITNEINAIDEKLSHLDLFWLDKINKEIKDINSELNSLRNRKEQCAVEKKGFEDKLHSLEYETLPDKYQVLNKTEDQLEEDFTAHYQQSIGLPRYEQEIERLKRPSAIAKNFSDNLQRTYNEVENAKTSLFSARNSYLRDFQPCSFKPDVLDNDEFETERKQLEESELPSYRKKIKKARESALEQFQNDFLAKIKSSIDQVREQVKNLNRALDGADFGTDRYRFIVERSPENADYYDMIMAPELMEWDGGLFALPFQQKYGALIDDLFGRIATSDDTELNARKQSELQQNIEIYTDFRTYLKFDLETTDSNGSKQLLSQTMNTKSGGETQTPFYIAVLASFAQLYRVNDKSGFGNTMRLVVFDEAFNKMDSDRIIESVRLLRKMHLQAIICTPPDKIPDIMPEADKTLYTYKDKYTMQILPYSKEIADKWSEN